MLVGQWWVGLEKWWEQALTGIKAWQAHNLKGIICEQKQQGTFNTHQLEAKERNCEQASDMAKNHSNSLPREPGGIVSRVKTQQGTTATHFLESQGQALSGG